MPWAFDKEYDQEYDEETSSVFLVAAHSVTALFHFAALDLKPFTLRLPFYPNSMRQPRAALLWHLEPLVQRD